MYDMHYDLLTILYYNLKKNNPLANPEKLIEDCKRIYHDDNIKGGIINLYFESVQEMEEELGISKQELDDVMGMFKESVSEFKSYQAAGILPEGEFIYGIEGCDYLRDANDLTKLYNMGLRSITPVWNNKNKFGSGNRSDSGITEKGVKLIIKAIDLNMIVDVSHANPRTFFGITSVCNGARVRNGKSVNLVASHSNVRSLCDRERNLTDAQLHDLDDAGGYIGLFTNGNFLSLDNTSLPSEERINNYLKHLDYVLNVIKFTPERIFTSTDNMDFAPQECYHNLGVCPHEQIHETLHDAIAKKYDNELADMVLTKNAKRLIQKVR